MKDSLTLGDVTGGQSLRRLQVLQRGFPRRELCRRPGADVKSDWASPCRRTVQEKLTVTLDKESWFRPVAVGARHHSREERLHCKHSRDGWGFTPNKQSKRPVGRRLLRGNPY